jgi:DNA invertase Pin-like site-specific DNA recombinase
VNIVTLAEGDITHLHVGLKGTMNALFLKDLADKTRRGLRGRVELGKSGGGLCYGYRVTRAAHDGAAATGDREIVPHEAEAIRRIFRDYAAAIRRDVRSAAATTSTMIAAKTANHGAIEVTLVRTDGLDTTVIVPTSTTPTRVAAKATT